MIENGRIVIRMWAAISDRLFQAAPIVKFIDRHGNLYYAYKQQVQRFGQNADFIQAAREMDPRIRHGPRPDQDGP